MVTLPIIGLLFMLCKIQESAQATNPLLKFVSAVTKIYKSASGGLKSQGIY
jgi:hypothetical protein